MAVLGKGFVSSPEAPADASYDSPSMRGVIAIAV
jgi:hypothetical protein